MSSILLKGGTLVTMDAQDSVVQGDLLIRDGRIAGTGEIKEEADVVLDATGAAVLPGFVQAHVHLCQTIFRGAADDLALIDWLKKRVWPLEAAHTPGSIRASALLGVAELIKSGTTCAMTMETVNHTEEVFKVVEETGFRATIGKCMMDKGEDVPPALSENTENSIRQSLELLEAWHGQAGGRIRFCFAPRFAISCTTDLLNQVARLARDRGVMVHTHASENRAECAMVESDTGLRNIDYLHSLGLTGKDVALAHCVHLIDEEIEILKSTQTNVVHCPSSNLKLGSGIAPIATLLDKGVPVSLGADGAACNNRLDMFTEMRTAALLQKVLHGPQVLPARQALRMATIEGARALGLAGEIGSLEAGKRADLILVDLKGLGATPRPTDIVSTLVYSSQSGDVKSVIIDGQIVMAGRQLTTIDELAVINNANLEAELLFNRAGLN